MLRESNGAKEKELVDHIFIAWEGLGREAKSCCLLFVYLMVRS